MRWPTWFARMLCLRHLRSADRHLAKAARWLERCRARSFAPAQCGPRAGVQK
jgi:hypothetical protein